jgi:hypothetical protein
VLQLPNNNWSKPEMLASWAELNALADDGRIVLRGEMLGALRDSGLFADVSSHGEAPDSSTPDSSAAVFADTWRILERRAHLLGDAWPLVLTKDTLARRSGREKLESVAAYAGMLLIEAASSKWYPGLTIESGDKIRELFEHIVVASVSKMLGGLTCRFGAPFPTDWPTNFVDRVKRLCEVFEVEARESELGKFPSPNQLDDSLDVLGRWKLLDEAEGTPFLLFQCATGENWLTDKAGQPSMTLWGQYVSWNGPQYKALAIPFTLRERGQLSNASIRHGFAFVFDRLRIAFGMPDDRLEQSHKDELTAWCKSKFDFLKDNNALAAALAMQEKKKQEKKAKNAAKRKAKKKKAAQP